MLRPTLSDYGGWALLCGDVPADVAGHWFAALHHLAGTPTMRERGWATWRRPTWDNPQIPLADLDEARQTLGARVFLREYGAELVGAAGGVWREAWFDGRAWTELPAGLTRAVVTLDAAWTTGIRNDFSAAQLWARTATDYYLLAASPGFKSLVSSFRFPSSQLET